MRMPGPLRRGRDSSGAATVALCLAASLLGAPLAASLHPAPNLVQGGTGNRSSRPSDVVDPPALPDQPGVAAPACSVHPPDAGSWERLSWNTVPLGPAGGPPAGYRALPDPWLPCRVYRSTDIHTVERTTDAAQSWHRVFFDNASSLPGTTPFTISSLAAPRPGTVLVAERGNGDAVVRSDDAGATWHLANQGLAGAHVQWLAFASGDSTVGYAITNPNGITSLDLNQPGVPLPHVATTSLYRTRDGGATWEATAFVPPKVDCFEDDLCGATVWTAAAVDPANSGHVWVTYGVETGLSLLYESSDAGASWSSPIQIPSGTWKMLPVHTARHPSRLYILTFSYRLEFSDDDGQTWTTVPITNLAYLAVAVDPAQPDTMIVTGSDPLTVGRIITFATDDDFESVHRLADITPVSRGDALYPARSPDGVAPDALQVDQRGVFYLNAQEACPASCVGFGTCTGSCSAMSLWRIAIPVLTVARASRAQVHHAW